jgi:tetratricopeptide (TPR) repeat protein
MLYRGRLLMLQGHFDDAVVQVRDAASLAPQIQDTVGSAALVECQALYFKRAYPDASAACERAMGLGVDGYVTSMLLSALYRHAGQPAKAQQAKRRALEEFPDLKLNTFFEGRFDGPIDATASGLRTQTPGVRRMTTHEKKRLPTEQELDQACGDLARGVRATTATRAADDQERHVVLDGIERVMQRSTHTCRSSRRATASIRCSGCVVRTQVDDLSAEAFNAELGDIFARLRDWHTGYWRPRAGVWQCCRSSSRCAARLTNRAT